MTATARVSSRRSYTAASLGNMYPSEAALADQHALAALGALFDALDVTARHLRPFAAAWLSWSERRICELAAAWRTACACAPAGAGNGTERDDTFADRALARPTTEERDWGERERERERERESRLNNTNMAKLAH